MSQCPICHHPTTPVLHRSAQNMSIHDPSAGEWEQSIDLCSYCGFAFDRLAFAKSDEFYSRLEGAYQSYQLMSTELHGFPYSDPRSETALELIAKYQGPLGLKYALEIGSNRGDFLALLQRQFPQTHVMGIETSPLATGVPTLFADARNVHLAPMYDLIIIRQVLEHIADPVSFLQKIKSFLSPQGRILIEVPDLENDLSEGIEPFVVEHVGHYSNHSLQLIAPKIGMECIAVDRSYQCTAIFAFADPSSQSIIPLTRSVKLFQNFDLQINQTIATWKQASQEGRTFYFYGASNAFLAMQGVLKERGLWDQMQCHLIDDYPAKHSQNVLGIQVQSWEQIQCKAKGIIILCAMYRYHRQKMIPRARAQMTHPDTPIYTMWHRLT